MREISMWRPFFGFVAALCLTSSMLSIPATVQADFCFDNCGEACAPYVDSSTLWWGAGALLVGGSAGVITAATNKDKGDRGGRGCKGDEGFNGQQGNIGNQGGNGAPGPSGPTGCDGPRGPTGPTGSETGSTGPIGPPGPTFAIVTGTDVVRFEFTTAPQNGDNIDTRVVGFVVSPSQIVYTTEVLEVDSETDFIEFNPDFPFFNPPEVGHYTIGYSVQESGLLSTPQSLGSIEVTTSRNLDNVSYTTPTQLWQSSDQVSFVWEYSPFTVPAIPEQQL